jgi:hypothetical protein
MSSVTTRLQNIDKVKSGLEQALQDFGEPKPENGNFAARDRIQKIGAMSARAIAEATETTANEVEQAGTTPIHIAHELMAEAQQLANAIRDTGEKMSERLQEFAFIAKKVGTAMRDTRAEVLDPAMHANGNPESPSPSDRSLTAAGDPVENGNDPTEN